jgi:diaphanous 1
VHRHFSAFPLTSHLHTPYLRLVSLHPHLALSISFLRVPEIHDGFRWTIFLARSTTTDDVIAAVSDELGLAKVLSGPGGGNVDYVLDEVWQEGDAEGTLPGFVA